MQSEESFGDLGVGQRLADWSPYDQRPQLATDELVRIATEALELTSDLYVHLSLKRRLHAADPERRLKVLLSQLGARSATTRHIPTEEEFHVEMLEIFAALRDLHTRYILPRPWRNTIAFLPFAVEECYGYPGRDSDESVFVVTKTAKQVNHPTFEPGVRVTHWNGTPVDLIVDRNGRRCGGSNRAAQRARGTEWLTFRWLGAITRPDEEQVRVRYKGVNGHCDDVEWDWHIAQRPEDDERPDPLTLGPCGLVLGLDQEGEWIRRVKRSLFAPAPEQTEFETSMPDVFRAQRIPESDFGYLRIFTFFADNRERLVAEAERLLRALPPAGLAIDVRANNGGDIEAAEDVLQLLGGDSITREPFAFRNTTLTARLVETSLFAADQPDTRDAVLGSITQGLETGARFSRGFALESSQKDGHRARAYDGPVALVVDALSYSATDVFAAGFQDNALGRVIGTSDSTGAGGANVWPFEWVQAMLSEAGDSVVQPLAHGASFTVAVRRSTRVGPHIDTPLEDFGVQPDGTPYRLTFTDVMKGNTDLRIHAAEVLTKESRPPVRTGPRLPRRGRNREARAHAQPERAPERQRSTGTYIVLADFIGSQPRPRRYWRPGGPPEDPASHLRDLVDRAEGVNAREVWATFGPHDIVAVLEADTAMHVAEVVRALSAVADVRTTTLTALDTPAESARRFWDLASGHLRGGHLRGGHLRGGYFRGG
jgi:hypothetical protein